MKIRKRRIFRMIWACFAMLFLIGQWQSFQSKGIPDNYLRNDDFIEVIEDNAKISFEHKKASNLEVIFFPGGLVDPKAYIPFARAIANSGYNTHIIKMPWRMATHGYNRIKEIFDLSDKETKIILGGHSQGGKMAAQFTFENKELVTGLFLVGTSHPRDIDMSSLRIPCVKIYAENDGLASVEEVLDNKSKLPKNTQLDLIKGGNHSQFGYFGQLLMDGKATISREKQHQEMVHLILNFIDKL